MSETIRMSHSASNLVYHFVCPAKYRRNVFDVSVDCEIKDAVVNASGAENVSFLCADAADKLDYISRKQQIDTLIVDPPRSGLDDNMFRCIMKSRIKSVIYISCNPATLGKNLSVLQERYVVKQVIPFDMFPNTAHIESVVLMT